MLRFNVTRLTVHAGTVELMLSNPSTSGDPHGISLEGHGVDKDGKIVQPGGTSIVTAKLKAGSYTFYCPVPGHEQAGMKGRLVVS
jgi:uncharacterized cupredoxin-like copper-binding protein